MRAGPTIPAAWDADVQSVMNIARLRRRDPRATNRLQHRADTGGSVASTAARAATNAGLTGQLYRSQGSRPIRRGTFVQVDPSLFVAATPSSRRRGNYALGYVLAQRPDPTVESVKQQAFQQMGYNPSNTQNISYQQFNQLVNAAPQQSPQQTLASIQAYQTMNQNQNTSALATAKLLRCSVHRAPNRCMPAKGATTRKLARASTRCQPPSSSST